MTNANGAVANFDVRVGPLARLDAVEPVLDMRFSDPAFAFPFLLRRGIRRVFDEVFWIRSERVAIDFHFAFSARKDRAAHGAFAFRALEADGSAVGVFHQDDAIGPVGRKLGRTSLTF